MGCCLSTTVTATPAKPSDHVDQEETVKEVVSETQTPSPSLAKTGDTTNENNSDGLKEPISELVYSISGSFSATTIHDGDEAGEVNQRRIVHKRSSCRVNARAKRGGGLRSLEPSNPRVMYKPPGPKSQEHMSRPAQGRTACSTRRNVGNLVEGSGRRSVASSSAASQVISRRRPPAVSSSVTGRPGGRSQVIRKLEESKGVEDDEGAFSRESLDNPRVSLECFIFL